jgi:hypothetical protein
MKPKAKKPPSGEIRQSQIISTFGPGAMVDLPTHSVLISGLNHWMGDRRRIREDRLEGRVCELLGINQVALYAPPVDEQRPDAPRTGITTFVFPVWFLAQLEETWESPTKKRYRSRPLVPWGSLVKGKYLSPDRKKTPVVPVRFVQACVNGHLSDIDWYRFVHDKSQAKDCRGQLWLDEGGSGNDFVDIFVRCEACKARRPLSDATVPRGGVLGSCEGHRPWLGKAAKEPCTSPKTGKPEYNRLLVRSASNAYFAQVLSVISLPDSDEALRNAVDTVYEDFLQYAEDVNDVRKERKKQKVANSLEGFSDDAIWAEVKRRQGNVIAETKSIKRVEIETLLSQPDEIGEDIPDGDFYARTRKLTGLDPALADRIDRIVLVHRLREVTAQIGFTRFEAAMPDIDGELSLNVRRAELDMEPTWVPAIENKGEGVFITFRPDAIEAWQQREAVQARGKALYRGFEEWRSQRGIALDKAKFPGLPYIMLHSLSHLLITAVSLECGYAASSIRERIYASDAGYGILLYTGTPGSEGTLGGLVQMGKQIEHHLLAALEMGKLCSNDPVCAQHEPSNKQEDRFLHGAACHGCLLIAEPSCERRNEFLDRALVIDTVEASGAAFFTGGLL